MKSKGLEPEGTFNLYWYQPVTKGWFQLIGGHVSYPIVNPTSTMLGLWDSLRVSIGYAIDVPQNLTTSAKSVLNQISLGLSLL